MTDAHQRSDVSRLGLRLGLFQIVLFATPILAKLLGLF